MVSNADEKSKRIMTTSYISNLLFAADVVSFYFREQRHAVPIMYCFLHIVIVSVHVR